MAEEAEEPKRVVILWKSEVGRDKPCCVPSVSAPVDAAAVEAPAAVVGEASVSEAEEEDEDHERAEDLDPRRGRSESFELAWVSARSRRMSRSSILYKLSLTDTELL